MKYYAICKLEAAQILIPYECPFGIKNKRNLEEAKAATEAKFPGRGKIIGRLPDETVRPDDKEPLEID